MVWVLNAPCGCRSGWLAANYPGAQVIPDEKSAWDSSCYSAVRVERMRAEGFAWTLHTASSVALDDCKHDPFLGSGGFVVPEGYRWLLADMTDTVEHLVACSPADTIELEARACVSIESPALCGVAEAGVWFAAIRADPCVACEAAAV